MTGWFGSSVVECWQMQIYASYEGICVEFERKNNTKLVFLLLNYSQVLKVFHD